MSERDFVYWVQGYAEICGACPTPAQWEMIKEHLQLVFAKVTGTPKGQANEPPFSWGDAQYCSPPGGNILCSSEPELSICSDVTKRSKS